MKNLILTLAALLLLLCQCHKEKACTMEFRMIQVTVKNADNTMAQLTAYYIIKTSTGDTIFTKQTSPYNDPYTEGVTIFTDNEMNLTSTSGLEFKFTAYQDSIQVVNENYLIRHDDCHIELVTGKTLVQL